MLDNAWILNSLFVAFGVFALVTEWRANGFSLDLNSVIIMPRPGRLHPALRPSAYIGAVKHAARISGSLVLQYPLYGGLMGIITTTGLRPCCPRSSSGTPRPTPCRSSPI